MNTEQTILARSTDTILFSICNLPSCDRKRARRQHEEIKEEETARGSLPTTHHEAQRSEHQGRPAVGKTEAGLVLVGVKSKTGITAALCECAVKFREGYGVVPQGIMY